MINQDNTQIKYRRIVRLGDWWMVPSLGRKLHWTEAHTIASTMCTSMNQESREQFIAATMVPGSGFMQDAAFRMEPTDFEACRNSV